jgi:hypothetical protein
VSSVKAQLRSMLVAIAHEYQLVDVIQQCRMSIKELLNGVQQLIIREPHIHLSSSKGYVDHVDRWQNDDFFASLRLCF